MGDRMKGGHRMTVSLGHGSTQNTESCSRDIDTGDAVAPDSKPHSRTRRGVENAHGRIRRQTEQPDRFDDGHGRRWRTKGGLLFQPDATT